MASEGSARAPDPSNEDRPQLTKRRRTTERPPADTEDTLKPLGASSSKRRTSTSTMERSASPTDAAERIRLTKTGRVSKASKGQRVHNCEECGKTYTRAEHLRRHQQNHKPGAYPCDVPGCTRAFYREDLLTRHKARHNDPLNPPSRRSSLVGQGSPDPGERMLPFAPQPVVTLPSNSTSETATTQSPVSANLSPRASQQPDGPRPSDRRYRDSAIFRTAEPLGAFFEDLSLSPKRDYIPLNQLRPQAQPMISIDTAQQVPTPYFLAPNWQESSPSRSPDDGTPGPFPQNGYVPQAHLPLLSTETSFTYTSDVSASRSPISASSSTHLPYWSQGSHSPAFAHSTPSSELSYGTYNQNYMDPQLWMQSTGNIEFEAARDFMETAELATPTLAPQTADFGPNLDAGDFNNEQRYFDAYWQSVHPLWPVVHRPSFDPSSTSPLLRASIIALGAQATGDRAHVSNARILHERCLKVLKQRTIKNWHSYRVCDMQAVLLVEIYAIFKSRRPPMQLSKPFEEAYNVLAGMASASATWQNYSNYGASGPGRSTDEQCQQRLLAACYILDQQHAAFFGRARMSILTDHPGGLVFPQAQAVWDSPAEQPLDLYGYAATLVPATYNFVYEAITAAPSVSHAHAQHDSFASMLLLAYLADDNTNITDILEQDEPARAIRLAVQQSPQVLMAYHTLMLCKHSHIRDLLAVAGESWVMAEKLTSQQDYTASQIDTKHWAGEASTEASDIHTALAHALEILKIHQACPKTGLLFQEWSVYLASIVIWARAYVTNRTSRKPRVSIPSPTEPRTPAHELDRTILQLIQKGSKSAISLREAKNVLMWTKNQIEKVDVPHNSGLTSGALDVLGKLVMRGSEEGHWF